MIHARELRIGNMVFNNYLLKEQETYPMMIAQIEAIEKEGGDVNMCGVALNSEWIERFGFKKDSENVWQESNENRRHHVVFNGGKFIYRVPGVSIREVRYVHEIQNLFFAITGEELPINDQENSHRDYLEKVGPKI